MKNKVLKALAYINGLVLVLSMCAVDMKDNVVPLTLVAVTGTWLFLFAYANGYTTLRRR